ncbi:LacI family DNA-binding transcriptional regulator [Celerinatantimonas sp. YJH-8]|uniref:LacI family DNA-binding transcriptional regulator n=1 Tax=Celerinatantimonas sp. YJH-8 TaxID=3228714 RepID=UPI0038C58631
MATINDVSRLAKVSKATVSRVLTGSRGVREESRQSVLKAVEALQYRPSVLAQNLANQRSNCVGVILKRSDSQLIAEALPKLAKGIQAQDLEMLVSFVDHSQAIYEQIERLETSSAAAIIVLSETDEDYSGERLISLSGTTSGCIHYDHRFACESATRYLLSQGHQQIALWLDDDAMAISEQLKEGYKTALENKSIPLNRQLIIHGQRGVEQPLLELLNRYLPFTALMTRCDSEAAIAMRLLRQFNIAVPQEVSVMSLEDSPLAQQLTPPLTCIHYPLDQLVDVALQRLKGVLHQRLDRSEPDELSGRLVIRESVLPATR